MTKLQSRIIHPDRVNLMTCNEIWNQTYEGEQNEEEEKKKMKKKEYERRRR